MVLYHIYNQLNSFHDRIEPFHDTWMLWLKNKSINESFEVMVSTILVQNTNWKNVEKALTQLKEKKIISFSDLASVSISELEEVIRPAGFFKQKSKSLQQLSKLMEKTQSVKLIPPSREALLKIKGIGKETADSILVYCFYQPIPIIGTYTRRFFARIFGDGKFLKMKYEILQSIITKDFPKDYFHLGRFHALIVSHSQKFCTKLNPQCTPCSLTVHCKYGNNSKSKKRYSAIQDEILGVN
ncbi:MAG: endonuclease [Candidatus Hodarchaeales archaeon]